MTQKKPKKLKSWLVVYAVMSAAVIFTTQSRALSPQDHGNLSPVMIDGPAPILTIDPVIRRSDL
ncbi:MAG: hypothetical protein KJO09_12330 [Gammaproteobacteria bacterium]|nr:hypothetical protein [Gammaproteobacteria bacterium]